MVRGRYVDHAVGKGSSNYLAHIHDNALVHFLPQVSPEDLNEGDFQSRDFPVHEYSRQIELDLETDIDVSSVDGRRPPQCEPAIGNLVETRTLSMGQLFVLHRLLEARGLLPEETLPRRKIGPLEEGVFQDPLHAPQSLDHVGTIVVQIPELSVMALVSPPERVLLQDLPRG